MRANAALAILGLLIAPAARATVVIKLASLAPRGSAYSESLEEMALDFRALSGGAVELRLYLDGVAGSEEDMVRKMGVGQIQAASLTTIGMHDIAPEPEALTVPGLIRTPGEFDYVLAHVQGRLDAALAARGFVAIGWAEVGTARFFSTFPLREPADAAKARIYCWQGDPGMARAWQALGFSPVVLAPSDILPALASGMINAVAEPPLFPFVSRSFERTHHMLDFDWALVSGATVVRGETWARIPAALRPALARAAVLAGRRMSERALALDEQAVREMRVQGLTVDEPASVADWQGFAARSWPSLRGRVIPADLFDRIETLVGEWRAAHPDHAR